MNISEQFITDILTNHGWVGLILSLLVLSIMSIILMYIGSWLKDIIQTFYKARKERKTVEQVLDSDDEPINLMEHAFFNDTCQKMKFDIPEMILVSSKPIMSGMYIDLIAMTVECFYNRMEEIAKGNGCTLDNSGEAWGVCLTHAVNDVLDDIEDKAIHMGVPMKFVRRYMRWVISYTNYLKSDINDLMSKPFYTDILRTHTILYVVGVQIVSMLGDLNQLAHSNDSKGIGGEYRGRDIEV